MRFPSRFEFARPWFDAFRKGCWKILGLQHVMQARPVTADGSLSSVQAQQIHLLTDRMAVMESVLNWRLYGIPARVENIKLEQSKMLAGSGDVERALGFLSAQPGVRAPDPILQSIKSLFEAKAKEPAFVVAGSSPEEQQALLPVLGSKGSILLDDPTNLLRLPAAEISTGHESEVVETEIMDALPLLTSREWGVIFLSDVLHRLTPIQQCILLTRVAQRLTPSTKVCFFISEYNEASAQDYWVDPRRLRPLTVANVKSLIEPTRHDVEVSVVKESGSFRLVELSLTAGSGLQ